MMRFDKTKVKHYAITALKLVAIEILFSFRLSKQLRSAHEAYRRLKQAVVRLDNLTKYIRHTA